MRTASSDRWVGVWGDAFADAEIWVRKGAVGVAWGGEGWGRWGWWGGLIRWGRGLGLGGEMLWQRDMVADGALPAAPQHFKHLAPAPLSCTALRLQPAPATCALNSLFLALRP